MICDVVNVANYSYYKSRNGSFLITFYKEDEQKNNFKLYQILKEYEREYNDLPILRLNYYYFDLMFQCENVTSPNDLLVIEKKRNNIIYQTLDKNKILEILQSLREKILSKRRIINFEYADERRKRLRPWIIKSIYLKSNQMNKYLNKSALIQYEFPNSTALLTEIRNSKKLNEIELPKSKKSLTNEPDNLKNQIRQTKKISNIESSDSKIKISYASIKQKKSEIMSNNRLIRNSGFRLPNTSEKIEKSQFKNRQSIKTDNKITIIDKCLITYPKKQLNNTNLHKSTIDNFISNISNRDLTISKTKNNNYHNIYSSSDAKFNFQCDKNRVNNLQPFETIKLDTINKMNKYNENMKNNLKREEISHFANGINFSNPIDFKQSRNEYL